MLFKNLEKVIRIKGKQVTLDKDLFFQILIAAIHESPHFDDQYYLSKNPDLKNSMFAKNPRLHYALSGYFENKSPGPLKINDDYYLKSNADVRNAVLSGKVKNLQLHYDANGFKEGRNPVDNFAIWKKL
jgi:hypothetical protein